MYQIGIARICEEALVQPDLAERILIFGAFDTDTWGHGSWISRRSFAQDLFHFYLEDPHRLQQAVSLLCSHQEDMYKKEEDLHDAVERLYTAGFAGKSCYFFDELARFATHCDDFPAMQTLFQSAAKHIAKRWKKHGATATASSLVYCAQMHVISSYLNTARESWVEDAIVNLRLFLEEYRTSHKYPCPTVAKASCGTSHPVSSLGGVYSVWHPCILLH